jgi:hypothetical protein
MHYHHDGCPACDGEAADNRRAAAGPPPAAQNPAPALPEPKRAA